MVQQLAPPGDETEPNAIAWICVYGPSALNDPSRIVALAEQAIEERGREHKILNTLGAAYYRAGRFNDALRTLAEVKRDHGDEGSLENWLFLAMTHYRLGHAAAATAFLNNAARSLDYLDSHHYNPRKLHHWDRSLVPRVLLREAESVIFDAAFPSDPFAN